MLSIAGFTVFVKQEIEEKHRLEIEQTNSKLQQSAAALQDKTSEFHQIKSILTEVEEQLDKLKVQWDIHSYYRLLHPK